LRISDYEKEIIVKIAKDIFGNYTKVYLFGSRVYDDKKGGDIDLYIIPDKLFEKEIKFKTLLQINLGEQKIDVVLHRDFERDIGKAALSEGVLLDWKKLS